ncbi:hypothetical protein VPHK373_0007 [Vibrio phage K373]
MKQVVVNGYVIDGGTIEKQSVDEVLINLTHTSAYGEPNFLQILSQNQSAVRSVDVVIASGSDLIRAKVKITGLYPELAETSVVINLQCECLSVFDINGDKIGVDFSIERM